MAFQKGPQQFRAFAVLDHVLGELADVEVVGDEVVDVMDFAGLELFLEFLAALAAGDYFAPGFGGQGEFRGRRAIPAVRRNVDDSFLNAGGKGIGVASGRGGF